MSAPLLALLLLATPLPPPPMGAPRPPAHPSQEAGHEPHEANGQEGITFTGGTHHDLIQRLGDATFVLRGRVLRDTPSDGKTSMHVAVTRWLKGDGAAEIDLRLPSLRSATPEGMTEVLFAERVAAPDGGEPGWVAVSEPNERWELRDERAAALDPVLLAVIAGKPADELLPALAKVGPRFAAVAVGRLGLGAVKRPELVAQAEKVVRDTDADPVARAKLLGMLASRLSLEAEQHAATQGEPTPVRVAAVEAIGQSMVHQPARRGPGAEVLNTSLVDPDAHVRLTAARGLAEVGDARALPVLKALSAVGEEPGQRAEAVRGIGALAARGVGAATSHLELLATDADAEVKQRATVLLKEAQAAAPVPGGAPPWLVGGAVALLVFGGAGLVLSRRARSS